MSSPSRHRTTLSMPARRATSACSDMCSGSPCTGISICGRTQPIISLSSWIRGCPDTCTRWVRSVMTSMPWATSPLMTCVTAFSLPGIAREEKITRSPRENATSGWSSCAMRESDADEFCKTSGDVGLGGRAPVAKCVSGIPNQRETALIAECAQLGFVGRRTHEWRRVDLPVAGVEHGPRRRTDDEPVRFRNGVSHRDQLYIERSKRKSAAEGYDVQRNVGRTRLALPLGFNQRRSKWRGIDRELEPWPQIEQRTEMILMRMGEHEAEKIVPLLHQVANVRHDEIDAGQRVVGKSNAEIDRNPLPALLVAEAVNREIHADLAGPAKRREHEISGGVHGREFRSRRLGGDGRGFQEHVPRCDGPIAAVGQSQHQAAGLVQGFETTNEFALRETHAHAFAHTGCAGEPVGSDGRKALAGIPLR